MSVLFQALARAARDDREHQSSFAVPFIPPPNRAVRPRWAWMGMLAALVLFAALGVQLLRHPVVTTGYSVFPENREPLVRALVTGPEERHDEVVAFGQEEPLPIAPAAAQALPPPLPATSLSDGIVLPVDGSSIPSFEDRAGAATEPALAEAASVADEMGVKEENPPAPVKKDKPDAVVKVEAAPSLARSLKEAHAAIRARDYVKAKTLFDEALVQDGNDQAAWDGKLFALQQIGSAAAKAELQTMASARPFSSSAQFALAQAALRLGDQQTALDALKRAVSLDEGNRQYALSLAVLHDQMGRVAEALESYRKIPPPVTPDVQLRLDYLAAQTEPKNTP